jgi:hypothetical protein
MASKIVEEVESLNKRITQIASKRVAAETESQLVLRNLRQSIVEYGEKYGVSLKGKNFKETSDLVRAEYERVKEEVEREYELSSKVVSLIEKGNVKEARMLLEKAEKPEKKEEAPAEEAEPVKGEESGEKVQVQKPIETKEEPKVHHVEKPVAEKSVVENPAEKPVVEVQKPTSHATVAPKVEKPAHTPVARGINIYVTQDEATVDNRGFYHYDTKKLSSGKSVSKPVAMTEEVEEVEEVDEVEEVKETVDTTLPADDDDFGFDDDDFGFGEFLGSSDKKEVKKEEKPNKKAEEKVEDDEPISLSDAFSFDDDDDDDGSSFGFGKMLQGSKFEV